MRRPWTGTRLGKEWITLLYWRINTTFQPFLSSEGHCNTRLPAASAARGAPKQLFSSQHLISVCGPDTGSRIFLLYKGWLYFTLFQTSRSCTSASSQAPGKGNVPPKWESVHPRKVPRSQWWTLKSRQHKPFALWSASVLHPFSCTEHSTPKQSIVPNSDLHHFSEQNCVTVVPRETPLNTNLHWV